MAASVSTDSGDPPSDQRGDRISVVIPALNEEANIRQVLDALPGNVFEVVLVDGGSTDATVEVARAARPDVHVVQQTRRGKGNALACGFEACTGDIIVMLDADGSTDAAEIPRFIEALKHGAQVAKGSRFTGGGGSSDITLIRKVGNRCLCALVNALYGTGYSDLCYGFNAFWRGSFRQLRIDCDGFEVETLINIRTAKAHLNVVEVPSFEHHRIHGESKLHPARDGWRVLKTILRERFSSAPVDRTKAIPPC